MRRRTREAVPRPKVVQFSLTQGEFDDVNEAAERCGLARGAFAAEATLAAARGVHARGASPLREALGELMAAAGLVRRIGTNGSACWLPAASLAALSADRAWVKSRCPARARARIACSRAAPVPDGRRVKPSSA